MRTALAILRIWLVRIGAILGRPLRLRPRVLLATSHADTLTGNLAFIRDELAARQPPIRHVTLAHRASPGLRGLLGTALASVRGAWYIATSRVVVVDDYYFPLYPARPRPGTTVIQTWHAGLFKKVGLSVAGKAFGADEAITTRVRIHAHYDVCLSASAEAVPAWAEAFGQPAERFVWHIGIPRTDLFFRPDAAASASARIRARYSLPDGRRTVLYAPTFRGTTGLDAHMPDVLDLAALREHLGDDHVVLLRAHPFVRARGHARELSEFVVDVSDWPDINELMFVSDVLVTDYSSSIYEFSLLDRPMAFFAPDHDDYERDRGLYVDYASFVPGPIFTTTSGLADWLRRGEFDLSVVREFRSRAFAVADGAASRRFVDELVLPALR